MRRIRLAAGLVLLIVPGAAAAEDWRYCLAAVPAEHKVYISGMFQTGAPIETIQTAFGRTLTQLGVEYGGVQCPRADSQASLSAMQQTAIGFNRDVGNRAIKLDWKPPR
jgi:hypothetical protein